MKSEKDQAELKKIARSLGIGHIQRHIFICLGPDCCSEKEGKKAWDFLKTRLKQLGLSGSEGGVYRSKAGCLRVCTQGPIALVYPEGTWYSRMTPERLEIVIQEHLINGRVVKDFIFEENPLISPKDSTLNAGTAQG